MLCVDMCACMYVCMYVCMYSIRKQRRGLQKRWARQRCSYPVFLTFFGFGIWSIVDGVWCMVYGVWCMVMGFVGWRWDGDGVSAVDLLRWLLSHLLDGITYSIAYLH
jgi:hypothetical protein